MADKVDVLDLLDRAQSAMDYTQAAREAAQSCGVLPGDFRHLRTAIDELIVARGTTSDKLTLARIEARESKHQTRLQSITDEVTEVKAAHGGWLAVGSFMDRHRKVASTVAFLVLLGFQIFHLLRK